MRQEVERRPCECEEAVVSGKGSGSGASGNGVVGDAVTAFNDLTEEVSFCIDSLAAIKAMIHESVRRWRWRMASLVGICSDTGNVVEGLVWKPVADIITKGRWHDPGEEKGGTEKGGRLTKGERGALKSAVAGGQWPQTR